MGSKKSKLDIQMCDRDPPHILAEKSELPITPQGFEFWRLCDRKQTPATLTIAGSQYPGILLKIGRDSIEKYSFITQFGVSLVFVDAERGIAYTAGYYRAAKLEEYVFQEVIRILGVRTLVYAVYPRDPFTEDGYSVVVYGCEVDADDVYDIIHDHMPDEVNQYRYYVDVADAKELHGGGGILHFILSERRYKRLANSIRFAVAHRPIYSVVWQGAGE